MKSIFAHFRKEKKAAAAPVSTSDASQVQHSFGEGSAEFIPRSKTPVILAGVLVLGLGVFGYQFLNIQEEAAPLPEPKGGAALSAHVTTNQAQESIVSARKLFENKQLDESITAYKKVLSKEPRDAQVLNDLGVLYLKKQAFAQSEEHLKRSIEEAPTCVVCLNNLGYLKTLQGESAEAESLLKKALAINGSYVDPYFNLGVLYEKNGDLASSATAYSEFLNRSKDPNSAFNIKLRHHVNTLLGK